MTKRSFTGWFIATTCCAALIGMGPGASGQSSDATHAAGEHSASTPIDRVQQESALDQHVQLTSSDQFIKAGESYFSPDDQRIIFQGIERPADGAEPERHYQMFIADVVLDDSGFISGIDNIERLSPPGSANTCGWFHPTRPDIVIFGSTIAPPADQETPGYQRGVGRYVWQFPPEMNIVECNLAAADGAAASLRPLVEDDAAYLAECVFSPDGRFLVYCRREKKEEHFGGDLIVRDMTTGNEIVIAGHDGYDGGPFFSPDGKRLCYRSDRRGNNLLQIFVAELAFDERGRITGLEREFQLTDNAYVNWAPFWHPTGRYLAYATSAQGHRNYEIYFIDADAGDMTSAGAPARYGTRQRRITHAEGFDGLPAFNSDGSVMIWTSQRADGQSSQLWAARFILPHEDDASATEPPIEPREQMKDLIHVTDPETGTIYIYNTSTHEVSTYDPATHETTTVTDPEQLKRATELFRKK